MGYSSDPNKQRVKVVSVRVDSSNTAWRDRTLAEIEAQLERTWQRVLTPVVSIIAILTVSLVLFLSQLTLAPFQVSNQMWLKASDVEKIAKMLEGSPVISEEQSREVTTIQLRNFVEAARPSSDSRKQRIVQRWLLFIPLSIVLICVIGLLRFYPKAVFLWGDEEGRHADRIFFRRAIWAVIIGACVTGVGARFLGSSIERWLQ
jgi:hypothetical protein